MLHKSLGIERLLMACAFAVLDAKYLGSDVANFPIAIAAFCFTVCLQSSLVEILNKSCITFVCVSSPEKLSKVKYE